MPTPSNGPLRAIRTRAVGAAAMLWGFVLFMPVGMNYLAAGAMLAALACDADWRRRIERFRASPLRWPLVAFAAWITAVGLFGPHHPETGLSLWHDLRIWITLAVTTLLSAEESLAALKAFVLAAMLALLALALAQFADLPALSPWQHVIAMKGNKSINDALLFTLVGVSAGVLGLAGAGHGAAGRRMAAIGALAALAAGLLASVVLPSRTSLVALAIAILGACAHQWRGRLRPLLLAFAAAGALAAALAWLTPSAQQKFDLGLQELQEARAGVVSEGSWVVRFHMYRETAAMMVERPLAGWGLGAWTPEWQRRVPPLLADYSMPHNDFLWLGSETGVPGFLILLWLLLGASRAAWRRRDLGGRLAFAANLLLIVATSLNSALRDAAIGLSLPWIVFVYLQLGLAAGDRWRMPWAREKRAERAEAEPKVPAGKISAFLQSTPLRLPATPAPGP